MNDNIRSLLKIVRLLVYGQKYISPLENTITSFSAPVWSIQMFRGLNDKADILTNSGLHLRASVLQRIRRTNCSSQLAEQNRRKNNGYVFYQIKYIDGCTSRLCYCRLYPGACSARQQVNECLDSCCRRHHLPPMLKNHHQHQCHHQRHQHCHHHYLLLFQRAALRRQASLESPRVDAENIKIVVRLLKDGGIRLHLLYFKGCSRWN